MLLAQADENGEFLQVTSRSVYRENDDVIPGWILFVYYFCTTRDPQNTRQRCHIIFRVFRGQEVFKHSRVDSGRVGRCSKYLESGWVGSVCFHIPRIGSSHSVPTRSARRHPTRKKPYHVHFFSFSGIKSFGQGILSLPLSRYYRLYMKL